MSGSGNPRRVRVAQAMRELVAEMLDREVKDPRVHEAGLISLNHVELNSDMSTARVYVSFIGGPGDARAISRAMAGLEAAASFLRGPVARKLGLRRAPALRFVHDRSPELQRRITELVRDEEASRVEADDPDGRDRS